MAQKTFTYSVSCSGGSCKKNSDHVHNISISDLDAKLAEQIPANAVMRSATLQLNFNHQYESLWNTGVGYADVDIGVYFSKGGRAEATRLFDLESFRSRGNEKPDNHTWDMWDAVARSSDGSYRMLTNKDYLAICFMTDNIWEVDITCTTLEFIVEYDTYADFIIGGINVPGDIVYALDSNGTNIGTRAQIENDSDITIYARSYDGRKIVSVRLYDNTDDKDIWTQDGDELLQYLSEDGCVLNYPLSIEDYYVGKSWIFWVVFEEVVYVTYDNCFNHLQWFHEGLNETGITEKTSTSHTIEQSGSTTSVQTPLFKVKTGSYYYRFDFTSNVSNPNIYCTVYIYDNNQEPIDSGKVLYYASGINARIEVYEDCYLQFDIVNTTTGSKVTYSNFVMCPVDYEYMLTTLPASKRAQSGKWNMPTPTRKGYKFKGWNTQPNGSGTTYTSNMSFPTEDLVLYSQWEQVANVFVGSRLVDVYVGNRLVDVYIGNKLV